jgi:hypothetical protein
MVDRLVYRFRLGKHWCQHHSTECKEFKDVQKLAVLIVLLRSYGIQQIP